MVRRGLEDHETGTRVIVWAIFWATFYISLVIALAVWFVVYGPV